MSPRSHGPSAGPTKPSALAGRFIAFSVSFCGPGLPHCSCIATSPNSVAQILKEIKFFFFLIKKNSFTYTRFFTFPSNSGLQLHFIRQVKVSHLRGFNKKKCKCSLTIISCAFYSRQRHVYSTMLCVSSVQYSIHLLPTKDGSTVDASRTVALTYGDGENLVNRLFILRCMPDRTP